MNGGSQAIGRWANNAEAAAADPEVVVPAMEQEPLLLEDEIVESRDRWPLIAGLIAAFAAVGWLAVVIASHRGPWMGTTLPEIAAMIRDASAPLALIGVIYLLIVRASRSEASRFGRISANFRAERSRLEATMTSVAQRIDSEREAIAGHAEQLMSVGDDAADRLRSVSEKLRQDIDVAARNAEALKLAAGTARRDVTSLMGDIPQARAQTEEMTQALQSAGLAAHEQAGALDSQVAALIARGREADEVAGGAAQKLAAHLARVEGVTESAGTHLSQAADTITSAIDHALERAAAATDAARQGMEAQGATLLALVEQGQAAIERTGADSAEAVAARVADVTAKIEALGGLLATHRGTSEQLIADLETGIARIDDKFAVIDGEAAARNERLSTALAALGSHATTLSASLESGSMSAETMIGRAETLMTALDAATREIDETLPAAFARLDTHADASRAKIAEVAPQVAQIEREASAALDRLIEAEAALAKQGAALDDLSDRVEAKLAAGKTAAADLVAAVEGADARTREIADRAGQTLVDAMVRVRETAQTAAERAREALAAVVPDSADRLSAAVKQALSDAVSGQVQAQIGELAVTAENAVASANAASDRLMRQMLTIAETSAQVETRIAEARGEIDDADRDNFARRVALLIESLNSTAIDVAKIMSNEVTDSAWSAYLKGDRSVFARRAVRLLDAGEVREVARHYDSDPEFREQVNRYVRDFEAMLRNVLATRAGSPLSVTLLSSDMGKLYVALAQAIERLRT